VNIYYKNGLPVMLDGLPMLAPLVSFMKNPIKRLEQTCRLWAKLGYSITETFHLTQKQKAAARDVALCATTVIYDFKLKPCSLAINAGASPMAAIVISLGDQAKVLAGLRVSSKDVQDEVIDVIFNCDNIEFAEARSLIDPYCYDNYRQYFPVLANPDEVTPGELDTSLIGTLEQQQDIMGDAFAGTRQEDFCTIGSKWCR
jgi:hypothetical protein